MILRVPRVPKKKLVDSNIVAFKISPLLGDPSVRGVGKNKNVQNVTYCTSFERVFDGEYDCEFL